MKDFGGVCNHAGFTYNDACEYLAAWSPELREKSCWSRPLVWAWRLAGFQLAESKVAVY